jgi:hypothetical protein
VVFFEKYCQYSDLLLLELRLEVGVGVLDQATSLVLAPEDAELTERTKAGVEPPPPKGWLSCNVDSGSGVSWEGGAGMAGVMPTAAATVPE